MAEIPDYLVPRDGLTNSSVQFEGLDALKGTGGARMRFAITDEDQRHLCSFEFDVPPQTDGTVDSVVAAGHRHMRDVVRQKPAYLAGFLVFGFLVGLGGGAEATALSLASKASSSSSQPRARAAALNRSS